MASLKNGECVLEKLVNFLFKKGYEPCTLYWTKVLGIVLHYSYFSVISRFPLKTVHHFQSFLAVVPPQYCALAAHTLIPIKVAPVKHGTWSMFPSLRCTMVVLLVAGSSVLFTLIGIVETI